MSNGTGCAGHPEDAHGLLPEFYWAPNIHFVLWQGPCIAGLASMALAIMRRRRAAGTVGGGARQGPWPRGAAIQRLLRIERPSDGFFAMEELGRVQNAALSLVLVSCVLLPWLLFLLAFVLGAVMAALEGWSLDEAVPFAQFALSLLLHSASPSAPASLGGKVWGILMALCAYVVLNGFLGALSRTRAVQLLLQRLPGETSRRPRPLLVALLGAPAALMLLGLFMAVLLALLEKSTFTEAWLVVMDFLTTRGSLRLAPALQLSHPLAILLLQFNLVFSQVLGAIVVGAATSHQGLSTFMGALEGQPDRVETKSTMQQLDGRFQPDSREAKLAKMFTNTLSAQNVSNTAHLGGSSGNLERRLNPREATSMENLMLEQHQQMSKARRTGPGQAATDSRSQLQEGRAATAAPDPPVVEDSPPGPPTPTWAAAFQAPEPKEKSPDNEEDIEDELDSGAAESQLMGEQSQTASGCGDPSPPSQQLAALQEELAAAETRFHEQETRAHEAEDRGRELQMQLGVVERDVAAALAKIAEAEKKLEAEKRSRLETEHRASEAYRQLADCKDALKKAQAEAKEARKIAKETHHGPDDEFWAAERAHKAELEVVKATVISTESRLRAAEAKLNTAEEEVRRLSNKLRETEDRATRAENAMDEWRTRCQEIETQLRGLTQTQPRDACCSSSPFGANFGANFPGGFGDLTARLAAPFAATAVGADVGAEGQAQAPSATSSPRGQSTAAAAEEGPPMSARFSWAGVQESIRGEIQQMARTRGCAVPGASG